MNHTSKETTQVMIVRAITIKLQKGFIITIMPIQIYMLILPTFSMYMVHIVTSIPRYYSKGFPIAYVDK